MTNLETPKNMGQTPEAGLVFGDRKLEQFALAHPEGQKVLEKIRSAIEKSPKWQKMAEKWKGLTDNDQETLYTQGEPTLKKVTNAASPMPDLFEKARNFWEYDSWALKMAPGQIADLARVLVQLKLLPAPKAIAPDQLLKDTMSDAKQREYMLKIVGIIITVFAPEAKPEFEELKGVITAAMEAETKTALGAQKKKEIGTA